MKEEVRVEFQGLAADETLVIEGILLGAADEGVTIERPGDDAGIDPLGIIPFLLVFLLSTGTVAFIVRTVLAVRRQFAPFCVNDTRGGKTKIRFDKSNKSMRGKTLLIAEHKQQVTLEEDAGLDEVTKAVSDLFKE